MTNNDLQVELQSARLCLRAAVTEDAEHLHHAFKDPEVMRYWSELPHKEMKRTQEWTSGMVQGPQNGVTDFMICLKPDLNPIGKIGVWQGDEIGFLLERSQWHKGLAKEAMNTIMPHLFNTKEFESLTADVDPRNEASIALLKKFGFEVERFEERTFQLGEEWVDSVYLRLTKERWVGGLG